MPDTPFCSIDPWLRWPREATRNAQPGDDAIRHLAAEVRRLRHELRAVRSMETIDEEIKPSRTRAGGIASVAIAPVGD
jgi:hypothetical protein